MRIGGGGGESRSVGMGMSVSGWLALCLAEKDSLEMSISVWADVGASVVRL